jgi:uncharacterized protein YdeI (YjbR/CyaY-like superfamily)
MEITETIKLPDRAAWRDWLMQNHRSRRETWLLYDDRPAVPTVSYLDSVEEALCFGWIDSIQKRFSADEKAQRFTPRKKRSNWTELNKERVRRLIRLGAMTESGLSVLPDLDTVFVVPEDIIAAIQAESDAWENFSAFPDLYVRVRVGYIEEVRKNPAEFDRRLKNFIAKTVDNKMIGNWNDGGRLL